MKTLNMLFVDLIAYVPAHAGRPFTVLLPDTSPKSPHTPYLIFKKAEYESGDPGLPFGPGGIFNSWQLSGEELSVPCNDCTGLTMGDPVQSGETLPGIDPSLPARSQNWRFNWTTHMESLHTDRDKGHVRRACLGEGLGVAARVALQHGRLQSLHFLTKDRDDQEVFTHKFKDDGAERALVNATLCRMELNNQPLVIKSNHFTGANKREMVFKSNLDEVDVIVVNLGANIRGSAVDEHFKFFYNLVSDWGQEPEYIPSRQSSRVQGMLDLPPFIKYFKNQIPGDATLDREACPHVVLLPPL